VTVIPPGGGEVIGDAPDRTVLVLSDRESLAATRSRLGPGLEGADLHVHHEHTDLFYVLTGELTIRLGVEDEQVAVPAGRLVRVPPFVVHGFRNASDADVTYLNLHAPGNRFIDFMRSVRDDERFDWDQHDPPADGGRAPSDAFIGEPVANVEEIEIAEVRGGNTPPGDGRLQSLYVLEGELEVGDQRETQRAGRGAWIQFSEKTGREISGSARCLSIRTGVRSAAW
jgi:mannose-6-phosphate isomerase-like protein (cupin superfamily)